MEVRFFDAVLLLARKEMSAPPQVGDRVRVRGHGSWIVKEVIWSVDDEINLRGSVRVDVYLAPDRIREDENR